MRKPKRPKDEIIKDLGAVFRSHGFAGASLSLLTEATKLERASLYHHFPNGKADMAEAVLLQALTDLETQVINPLKENTPPEKKISQMLAATEKFYCGGNDLCFITIFSLGQHSKQASKILNEAVEKWISLLEKTLAQLKVPKPKDSAQQALATIQGALILANTMKDPKVFRNSLKVLKSQWLD